MLWSILNFPTEKDMLNMYGQVEKWLRFSTGLAIGYKKAGACRKGFKNEENHAATATVFAAHNFCD